MLFSLIAEATCPGDMLLMPMHKKCCAVPLSLEKDLEAVQQWLLQSAVAISITGAGSFKALCGINQFTMPGRPLCSTTARWLEAIKGIDRPRLRSVPICMQTEA